MMAQMYSILGSIQVGVIKKHSSVVGFTITISKNQISTWHLTLSFLTVQTIHYSFRSPSPFVSCQSQLCALFTLSSRQSSLYPQLSVHIHPPLSPVMHPSSHPTTSPGWSSSLQTSMVVIVRVLLDQLFSLPVSIFYSPYTFRVPRTPSSLPPQSVFLLPRHSYINPHSSHHPRPPSLSPDSVLSITSSFLDRPQCRASFSLPSVDYLLPSFL